MTNTPIDELSPELRDLLSADRAIPAVAPEVRARLAARLDDERLSPVAWRGPAEVSEPARPRRPWSRRIAVGALLVAAAAMALTFILPRGGGSRSADEPIMERHTVPSNPGPDLRPFGIPNTPSPARAKALRLQLADDASSPRKRALHEFVGKDNRATKLGIGIAQDNWNARNYRGSDTFLRARAGTGPCAWRRMSMASLTTRNSCKLSGRELLEGYLKQLYARKPALAPDGNHQILIEKIRDPRGTVEWRSYYAFRKVHIDGNDVETVQIVMSANSTLPQVQLSFRANATKRLAQVTASNIGRKLLIIRDGLVVSAPVIQGAITGGKAQISMGGQDAKKALRDAQHLVNSLRPLKLRP